MSLPLVNPQPGITLPPGFKLGIADSDLQVIGEDHTLAEEGSEPTMWKRFTEERGLPTPGVGIDRYHRWREDAGYLRRMGIRHYRTSVSMSRTLDRNGEVNRRAIEWYRRYFGTLKESDISIYAALYHWELPQYLSEIGGWTNRASADMLRRHAQAVVEHLGEFIEEYFILNEPWCSSMLSYYEGVHAPGNLYADERENLRAGIAAAHHLLLGQGLSYNAMKEIAPDAKISTVLNFEPAYATTTSPENTLAARIRDGYYNAWFLDAIFRGRYPEFMVRLYGEDAMPPGYERDMETIKIGDKLHVLGVNYYRGALYRAGGGELRSEQVLIEGAPRNSLEWPIFQPPYYSEGLYDLLQQIYFGYRAEGLKKMYVSENGMALATPWDGKTELIDDEPRVNYHRENLRQLHKALLRGIPVEGYFAWTLMDNFEWSEGYRPESAFGMIHVDRDSLERVWKKSALWYSELLKTHDVSQADASVKGDVNMP
ncbi:MAG TPA: family 1 glycosylhydrolase [Chloroflexia bacterium]|nr:family 1 glycosylhydrolase [Chloroflexia bacterium]